jgi:hypothetical protein
MWRSGLFYKLKDKIKIEVWRVLIAYYKQSKIIVKHNGVTSNTYKTSEGVKQGGIISPFLFNFFMNDLIVECINKNIGAKIKDINLSIIAYCDDILLLSPTIGHLETLLNNCQIYANKWKLEFNQKKSIYYTNDENNKYENLVKMNNIPLEKSQGFIYLGLPIGNRKYKNEFLENRFKKVEKSFYSLYSLGCKPYALDPKTIGTIYKIFCQSIFKYGLEMIYMSTKMQKNFNTRQSLLLKNSLSISKYSKTKPLLKCLKIEAIEQIYQKHKLFFHKQILANRFTFHIFKHLESYHSIENKRNIIKIDDDSYINQIQILNKIIKVDSCINNIRESNAKIENLYSCENSGLIDTINYLIYNFVNNGRKYEFLIKYLDMYLNYNFYNNMNQNETTNDLYYLNIETFQ